MELTQLENHVELPSIGEQNELIRILAGKGYGVPRPQVRRQQPVKKRPYFHVTKLHRSRRL